MRKCNSKFCERFQRDPEDRTNFPNTMAHSIAKDSSFHLFMNPLLPNLLRRAGVFKPRPVQA